MRLQKQRRDRAYQAKHRGSASNYKTEWENALLLIAWEAAELSEGQVASALKLDRVSLRKMRDDAIKAGCEIADELKG